MELIISKLQFHYEGLKIVLKEDDTIHPLAIVNGNQPDFLGPVILLNLDQHIVYGMSQPELISRVLTKGPQQLLTSKELAHNLFEHGMKASVGKLKIKLNWFVTTLETFYTLNNSTSNMQIIQGRDNKLACIITPSANYNSILISNMGFEPKDPINPNMVIEHIEIDNIRTYVSVILK